MGSSMLDSAFRNSRVISASLPYKSVFLQFFHLIYMLIFRNGKVSKKTKSIAIY